MFERDYQLKGKHAIYAKYLRDTAKVFKRHIDIYMNGAVMGFLHGRQVPEEKTDKEDVSILADVFIREKTKCQFIYRMVMLLDETSGLSLEQRADRAFRNDADEEAMVKNMDLFHSYMRGGIEYLHEKFSEECTTPEDYIDKIYEIVDRFNQDIKSNSYDESIQRILANS